MQDAGCFHEQSALGFIAKDIKAAESIGHAVLVTEHIFGMYRVSHFDTQRNIQLNYNDEEFLRFVVGKQNLCHVSGMATKQRLLLLRHCLELSSQVTRGFPLKSLHFRGQKDKLVHLKAAPP